MRLLVDSHTLLWMAWDSPRLSKTARAALDSPESELFLSAVSVWEITVKHAMGKLPLEIPPSRFIPMARERHGLLPLPLDDESVLGVARLPDHHRDPFDRMLVSQAIAHGLRIVTDDEKIQRYPAHCLW